MKRIWLPFACLLVAATARPALADDSQGPPSVDLPPPDPEPETRVRSPATMVGGILLTSLSAGALVSAPLVPLSMCPLDSSGDAAQDARERSRCDGGMLGGLVLGLVGAAGIAAGVAVIVSGAKPIARSPVVRLYVGPRGAGAIGTF